LTFIGRSTGERAGSGRHAGFGCSYVLTCLSVGGRLALVLGASWTGRSRAWRRRVGAWHCGSCTEWWCVLSRLWWLPWSRLFQPGQGCRAGLELSRLFDLRRTPGTFPWLGLLGVSGAGLGRWSGWRRGIGSGRWARSGFRLCLRWLRGRVGRFSRRRTPGGRTVSCCLGPAPDLRVSRWAPVWRPRRSG
jgi:hypothetical protein